jgi:hypothetical protein
LVFIDSGYNVPEPNDGPANIAKATVANADIRRHVQWEVFGRRSFSLLRSSGVCFVCGAGTSSRPPSSSFTSLGISSSSCT